MKKKAIVLQCLVLVGAILVFGLYWMYSRAAADSAAPEITFDGDQLTLSVADPEAALLQGVTAQDKRDGDVSASLVVESVYGMADENLFTVTYAAFDQAGNVSKAQRQVLYTDYESPKFTADRALCFAHGSGFDVLDHVGAVDALEGSIQRRVRATLVSDTGMIDDVGTHQVLFQVSNSLGDTVQLELPVEVYESDKYNATLSLKEYILYLSKGDTFNKASYLSSFQYGGEEMELNNGVSSGMTLEIDGTVDSNEAGVYPVSYTVSCTVGTKTYTGYSKLIVVVEE